MTSVFPWFLLDFSHGGCQGWKQVHADFFEKKNDSEVSR